MADFIITDSCPSCGGTGVILSHSGGLDESDNFVAPVEGVCPDCTNGIRTIGNITITELDDILDKCNDILDKCNDIFEKVNE